MMPGSKNSNQRGEMIATAKGNSMKKFIVKKSGNREPHPEGTWVGTGYGIEPLGLHPGYSKDPTKPATPVDKYAMLMETSERFPAGPLAGQRRRLTIVFSASLNEKSTLYKLAKALGCNVDKDDFDVSEMVGKSCLVSIRHEHKGDKVVTKYDAFAALPRGVAGLEVESKPTDVPAWVRKMQAQALDAAPDPTEGGEEGEGEEGVNDADPFAPATA
jgi:hypothetical protein